MELSIINNQLTKLFFRIRSHVHKIFPSEPTLFAAALWLIGLFIIPLFIIAGTYYTHTQQTQKQHIENELQTISHFKKDQILSYFSERISEIKKIASQPSTIEEFRTLTTTFEKSNQPLFQFIKSQDWKDIIVGIDTEFLSIKNNVSYQDIYWIDTHGNIIWTGLQNKDLGTNIFLDPYDKKDFGQLCQKSYLQDTQLISDVIEDETYLGEPVFFITHPVHDKRGERIGIIALKYTLSGLSTLMTQRLFGKTGDIIIIGEDLSLRSDSRFEKNGILKKKYDIHAATLAKKNPQTEDSLIQYASSQGADRVGVYVNVPVGTNHWTIITHIEATEAFAALSKLKRNLIASFIGFSILIGISTLLVFRKLIHPILEIKNKNNLELANSSQKINAVLSNEIWLRTSREELAHIINQQETLDHFSKNILAILCKTLTANVAALYLLTDTEKNFNLIASYGAELNQLASCRAKISSQDAGMASEAIQSKSLQKLHNVPSNYLQVSSALGHIQASTIYIAPIIISNQVIAIIEIGTLDSLSENQEQYLQLAMDSTGIIFQNYRINQAHEIKTNAIQKIYDEQQREIDTLRIAKETQKLENERLRNNIHEMNEKQITLLSIQNSMEQEKKELIVKNCELTETKLKLEQLSNKNKNQKDRATHQSSNFISKLAREMNTTNEYDWDSETITHLLVQD